jgi:hypothetical protein
MGKADANDPARGPRTSVQPCACDSAYQDQTYGRQMRLMNARLKGGWRCTVCGKDRA